MDPLDSTERLNRATEAAIRWYQEMQRNQSVPDANTMKFYGLSSISELDLLIDGPPDWSDDLGDITL